MSDFYFNNNGHNHCWWGDNNLFFGLPSGMISISFNSHNELRKFCNFLDQVQSSSEYFASKEIIKGFLITLENEDGRTRNLCLQDNRLCLILNISVEEILRWSRWLRPYIGQLKEI